MECKNYLQSCKIFTSRSHGQKVIYANTNVAASTGIVLNDEENDALVGFYSHGWSGMTSGSLSIQSTDSYEDLNLVLFIGCETAYGGNGAQNLPTRITNCGATVAVGFEESISCSDANNWTKYFYSYLLLGNSVQESVDYASGRFDASSGLQSAVVCGDGTYCLNQ